MSLLRSLGGRSWRGGRLYIVVAALVIIVVAGCGSGNSSAKPNTNVATPAPSQPAGVAAATTATPATRPAAGSTATAAGTAAPVAPAAALQAKIIEPSAANPQSWTYEPTMVTVPAGGRITWTNTGTSTHTVTADDGASFDSGAIQRGEAWTGTFTKPGRYPFHCTFHAWMKGTVVVTG